MCSVVQAAQKSKKQTERQAGDPPNRTVRNRYKQRDVLHSGRCTSTSSLLSAVNTQNTHTHTWQRGTPRRGIANATGPVILFSLLLVRAAAAERANNDNEACKTGKQAHQVAKVRQGKVGHSCKPSQAEAKAENV